MKPMTLCFPVRGDPIREVLLGYKKVGFGRGKYTGFGGKAESKESILSAAVRELKEESGLLAARDDLVPVGQVDFLFPYRPTWSQSVALFLLWEWRGQEMESREMRPQWFPRDGLPFDKMWVDANYWLPPILHGEIVVADFTFQEDNETLARIEMRA